ncbi:2-hydroxyacid dehydrogenase [Enterococcus saigonensis]|uniref:2-hydroxyacid dehydrogenase n=1 Tax=Enterococcus saigonensis TaxID=1805431 RepID=A0A679IJ21_9ENTE|nr:phosphoglycerate dehydrogenase [Enterococcus saigonensis]BCA85445.1 2-hydroxyacid dehydrogenase [Enterococcus saigonensis]
MSKFILSSRPFKSEFIDKIKKIAPQYDFITEVATPIDWQQVEITIGWQKKWDKLLSPDSNLKWVQSISAGVDYLPLSDFKKQDILLTNAKGIHKKAITAHVLTTILMRLRGFNEAAVGQRNKKWQQNVSYGNLEEQKILIVGTGQISQELARTLNLLGNQPTGVNTSGHDAKNFTRTLAISELKNVAKQFDFIVNILPLTAETYHLYDTDFFNLLNPNTTFINVGRGASVDTDALIKALQEKIIAYAALDVFEEEPLASDSPLWALDNILITPHIAGMVPHFQQKFMTIFLKNLESFITTQTVIKNQVDLTKGY